MRPAGHQRMSMPVSKPGQVLDEASQPRFQNSQRSPNLQYPGRVQDILAGRAPVDVISSLIPYLLAKLAHQLDHRDSRLFDSGAQPLEIDLQPGSDIDDLGGRLGRDHAQPP